MTQDPTLSFQRMSARAEPILNRLPPGPAVMVELGIFKGQMAEYLLRKRPDLIWHGVDNWLSVEQQPEPYRRTKDIHAIATPEKQAQWREVAYRALRPFRPRARVHEMNTVAAATLFEPKSVDLVFVDADHSYEGCMADLRAWWPKVKPGGWLSGHDYGYKPEPPRSYGVDEAVAHFALEAGLPLAIDGGNTFWFQKS